MELIYYFIIMMVTILALMMFDEDATKFDKSTGEYRWDYILLLVCGMTWPLTVCFFVLMFLDKMMKRALIINHKYRMRVRQQVVDKEKSGHIGGGVRIEE